MSATSIKPIKPIKSDPVYTPGRLPPEWAPQSGVMLTWPHGYGDWAARLSKVEPVFVDIAKAVAAHELVLIVCYDDAHRAHVWQLLRNAGVAETQLRFFTVPSNDTWARDHGPISVVRNGHPVLLDFQFNGWGNKYPADLDNRINTELQRLGAFAGLVREDVELVLEGGSIEVDGAGTLLTTSRCLLSPARNPKLNREQIEASLKTLLGVERILWLHHGYLAGDDTDSHIDTLARFCDARTIAYVSCNDPQDEHYAELKAMEQELRAFRTPDGEPYRLIALPWPRARLNEDGERLPATYANFLIINDAVLVPTYDDPADASALARVREAFPDRNVVGVACLPLIFQYGSLHCVTMQLPADVLL